MICEMNSNDSSIHEIDSHSVLRRLDLNLLLIFDVLMQEQNVSRAAERVFLSQSAMSNALKRLREMLDDPILVRGANGMQPTPRAVALETPVRSILQQVARTIQPAQPFEPETSRARFVIGMSDYSENIVLPPLAARLRQSAPNIQLIAHMLTAEDPEPLLETGQLSFIIDVDQYSKSSKRLRSESWISDRLVCLVAQNHPLATDQHLTLKQFEGLRHVYPSPLGLRTNVVETWLAEQGLQRSIAVTTRSYWAAAQIVSESDYLLSVPLRVATKLMNYLPLSLLEPPKGFPGFQLNLTWHPLYESDSETQWILNQIRKLSLSD